MSGGRSYVAFGPFGGERDLSVDADLRIEGHTFQATAVAGVGDIDGDDFDDLLIGAPSYDDYGSNAGGALLIHGPRTGTIDAADARGPGLRGGVAAGLVGRWR